MAVAINSPGAQRESIAQRLVARAEYEAKYQPSTNYDMLMDIYRRAMARRAQHRVGRVARVATPQN